MNYELSEMACQMMQSFQAASALPFTLMSAFAAPAKPRAAHHVFGIERVMISGKSRAVHEKVLIDMPFGSLIHFKCDAGRRARHVPKVLLVAPISGHRATILRDTVLGLLPDCDVYVTNWRNAREVPVSKGTFSLEDYLSYLQKFIRRVGPDTHLVGISQSTVPVLAATALMAARKEQCQPLSMTLMNGPIDPRINETDISRQSRQRDISWFEQHMIAKVPHKHEGRGRDVFPGFVQEMGGLARPGHIAKDDFQAMDADATYYLDTIQQVFLEHRLPEGTMNWCGEKIDPAKIRQTALMTIEGEDDHITAPGQTYAAHALCSHIKPHNRLHHLQPGAGHYDLFCGPLWNGEISFKFKGFIRNVAMARGIAYDLPHADTPVNAASVPDALPVLAA